MNQERQKKDDDNLSNLAQKMRPIAKALVRIQKQARVLGIFVNDRELLECTGCDLVEDVAFDGTLMTYHRGSDDLSDCGLRFEEVDDDNYRCPVCGTILKAVIL